MFIKIKFLVNTKNLQLTNEKKNISVINGNAEIAVRFLVDTSMAWDLVGFAAREFYLTNPIKNWFIYLTLVSPFTNMVWL